MNNNYNQRLLYGAWLALKIIYGLIALIAGLDKFLMILSPHSENVVSALLKALLPISVQHFLYGVGIFEIIVGALILTNYTYWGAMILMAWYLIIDINLFTIGPTFYLLILNNLGHAAASYALAQLTLFHRNRTPQSPSF